MRDGFNDFNYECVKYGALGLQQNSISEKIWIHLIIKLGNLIVKNSIIGLYKKPYLLNYIYLSPIKQA